MTALVDHISPSRLEKYEAILQRIDEEFKKCEELKKAVEKENNKIVATNIAAHESNIRQRIFRVNVKVFSSIFDIYEVLGDEIPKCHFQKLLDQHDCKFYLIEVHIIPEFQQKILSQRWILWVNIENTKTSINETVVFNSGFTNPLRLIVPFENSLEPCIVKTTLSLPSATSWTILHLEPVQVDISYHLEQYRDNSLRSESVCLKLTTIFQQYYNIKSYKELKPARSIEYSFKCCCPMENFFISFAKNCYHRLDTEVVSALSKHQNTNISLQLTVGDENKSVIEFNQEQKLLKISTSLQEMCALKSYFIRELKNESLAVDSDFYLKLMVSFTKSHSLIVL